MTRSPGFGFTRLQMLCRLSAYTLLIEFQISALGAVLPIRFQSERLLTDLGTILDLSSLPLLALPLLFGGLAGFARPAPWEWGLARLLRQILLLAAVIYLLMVPAAWVLGGRIQANADRILRQQTAAVVSQLNEVRRQVDLARDPRRLRGVLEAQPFPNLRRVLATVPAPSTDELRPDERRAALSALDSELQSINGAVLRRLSDNAGALRLQSVRLSAIAIAYALFFLLSWRVWPRNLPHLERLRALYPR